MPSSSPWSLSPSLSSPPFTHHGRHRASCPPRRCVMSSSSRDERLLQLRVANLKKVYRSGNHDLTVFENLSFEVTEGEMVAIVGESGSGKSTLLHILGALDRPTSGEIFFGGSPLTDL